MSKKSKTGTGADEVNAFLAKLDPSQAEVIGYIRKVILDTDVLIGEHIKWNAPAFYYTGEMKAFDAKTYQRDLVVMNLHKGRIMLVFPTGARIADTSGLLEGDYTDGRRLVNFKNMEDVKAREGSLKAVIRKWLDGVEK